MKRIAIVLLIVCVGIIVWFQFFASSNKTLSPLSKIKLFVSPPPTDIPIIQKKSLAVFVPYWSLSKNPIIVDADTLLYFGVGVSESGIDTNEIGYKAISKFTNGAKNGVKKLLVIRMINSSINSKVLEDKTIQKKIIDQSVVTAEKNGFSGIVLDFEIKALAFDSVVNNITTFYSLFAKQAHKNNLQFDITLYGDTFYLARPYDVGKIGTYSDHIYIMTYDFHKAGGNPGPNFPLSGKDTYGYDMKQMISDFSKSVPSNKLIITFGLFGYDWIVDKQNESNVVAKPLSYTDIRSKYLNGCLEKDCKITRNASGETSITFMDRDNHKHIIWFEDRTSMEKKKQFLSTKGLNSTAIWAYSYY